MKKPFPLTLDVVVASVAACLVERPRNSVYAVVALPGNPAPSVSLLRMMEEYAEFDELERYAGSPSFMCHVQGTIRDAVGDSPWSDLAGHECCREKIAVITADVVRIFGNIAEHRQTLFSEGEELGPASEHGALSLIAGLVLNPGFETLFASVREIAREQLEGFRGKGHLRVVH